MNKQRFINILKDYNNIPDEDRNKLHDLAKNYPYSQIIHTLVAKANHDARTPIAGQTLNYAAFYAADRHVLKEIIQESSAHSYPKETALAPVQTQEVVKKDVSTPARTEERVQSFGTAGKTKITISPEAFNNDSDNIRDAVLLDLENLKKSKASYLEWLTEDNKNETEEERLHEVKKPEITPEVDKDLAKKRQPAKSKKTAPVAKEPEEKKKTVKAKTKKQKSKADKKKTIITKQNEPDKNIEPKRAAYDEQKEIIENFINKEPSITAKPLKTSENQPDLSESSTSFNEDLVSENLAQILVNQGKKNKAIDIYKKLIWKFPQKKAYFASLIEELQK